MKLKTVRLFPGEAPGPSLAAELSDSESCFARFANDPDGRLWVCARVGRKVYTSPLAYADQWVQPGGGQTLFRHAA
jgi:hypothetical protein